MPIRSFLPQHAFDQEVIDVMSAAFNDACKRFGLADRDDPMTRLVARHIIELAQRGIRTKTALYFRTIEEFGTISIAGSCASLDAAIVRGSAASEHQTK